MKKFILSIVILLAIWNAGLGQEYQTAVGLRLGPSYGGTAKFFIGGMNAMELMVTRRWNGGQIAGLFEIHDHLFSPGNAPNGVYQKGLLWYFGFGGHVGTYNEAYVPQYWGWARTNQQIMVLGVDAILGLEYKFRGSPFNVSLDYKPGFNIIGHQGLWFDQGAASVRYTF